MFSLRIRIISRAIKFNTGINHSKGTSGNKTNSTRSSFSAATNKITGKPKSLGSLLRELPLAIFIPRARSPIETDVKKKLEFLVSNAKAKIFKLGTRSIIYAQNIVPSLCFRARNFRFTSGATFLGRVETCETLTFPLYTGYVIDSFCCASWAQLFKIIRSIICATGNG
jgi:hypothetical protein